MTLGERLGDWELARLIGRGGMGLVYEGRHVGTGDRVALKVLSKGADAEAVERFYWEAFVLSTVKHPNVVGLRGKIERSGGQTFYAMELLEGQDLSELLRARGGLTVAEGVCIAREVLAALEAIHARGFVHRDVKPRNVVLTRDARIVLVDFGIVRAIDGPGITRVGTYVGTPDYMAPEQRDGADVSPRTDVFGVGMLLTELVLGRPGKEGLPGPVAAVVGRALAPRPEDRWGSAEELSRALAALGLEAEGRRGLRALAGEQDTVVGKVPAPPPAPAPPEPPPAPPTPRAERVAVPVPPEGARPPFVLHAAGLLVVASVAFALTSFLRAPDYPYSVETVDGTVEARIVRVDDVEVVLETRGGTTTVPRAKVRTIRRR